MKKTAQDKALGYAYRLLSIRERSEKELKNRLSGKGYGRDTVFEVISLLKEKGIVDDLKFAKLWIESRMRQNPKGEIVLRKELAGKGVPASLIDKVLSEKPKDDILFIKELARKKSNALKTLPKEKARKKLFGFLARRGFDFEAVEEAVNEVFG